MYTYSIKIKKPEVMRTSSPIPSTAPRRVLSDAAAAALCFHYAHIGKQWDGGFSHEFVESSYVDPSVSRASNLDTSVVPSVVPLSHPNEAIMSIWGARGGAGTSKFHRMLFWGSCSNQTLKNKENTKQNKKHQRI